MAVSYTHLGAEALLGQETARTAALRRAEALRGQQEQARRRERVEGELARCERTLQRLGQLQAYLQLRDRRQGGEEQRRALTALREAALARGEAETALAAVSYTHLDVYKRQGDS